MSRSPEQREERMKLLKLLWRVLPEAGTIDGFSLKKFQEILTEHQQVQKSQLRPAVLLEALQQLQFAGYAMSTSAQANDDFINRRYWRVHRHI